MSGVWIGGVSTFQGSGLEGFHCSLLSMVWIYVHIYVHMSTLSVGSSHPLHKW